MKEFSNDKGFLILEISQEEMMNKLEEYGCLGVCDFCNYSTDVGFLCGSY